MWLPRSLPPLLSRLRRPASTRGRCLLHLHSLNRDQVHVSTGAAAGAWWSSWPKRPDLLNCLGSKPRGHLYLALDDWKHGFSLHKLGLDDLLAGRNHDAGQEPRRLPEPLLRLGFLTVGSYPRFHALGTSIVITSNCDRLGADRDDGDGVGLTLIYDTETTALDIENSLPRELSSYYSGSYDAVAAGGKLYTFVSDTDGGLAFLRPTESTISQYDTRFSFDGDEEPYCRRPQRRWIWERSPTPPPFCQDEDERSSYVSATALHPDGRTIFVSVGSGSGWYDGEREMPEKEGHRPEEEEWLGTFSLDTETGKWTRHGDWRLPFHGEARYDPDLDAWVGTRIVDAGGCGDEHLCSCNVPTLGEGPTPAPEWKVDTERLTFLEPTLDPEFVFNPVLLPMGCGVMCLVERAVPQGVTFDRSVGDGDNCLLRVTMFRAKYGKGGELVATPLLPGRSYVMSRYLTNSQTSAFWI